MLYPLIPAAFLLALLALIFPSAFLLIVGLICHLWWLWLPFVFFGLTSALSRPIPRR